MHRLPAERSLAHLVHTDTVQGARAEVQSVARTLAAFHAGAERSAGISACATAREVSRQFETNVTALAPFVGPVLDRYVHDIVVGAVRRYLDGRSSLFSARITAGHICDGHGDLQADDIYCLEDGPRILDCLEFDDRLRYGDVAADVAFLAMDLERVGAPGASRQFVREYEEAAGTHLPPSLLHLYIGLRAVVRAKVACIRHAQGDPDAAGEAGQLLELARSHLEQGRVRLILVGGLPGSGKSTLAAVLRDAMGATVLRSDELRRTNPRSATPRATSDALGRGSYAPERKRQVYDALIATAREHLALGESVILDASWIDDSHRCSARRLAEESIADLTELHCSAPPTVTEHRITGRRRNGADPSEATVEISREMGRTEAPWPSAVTIDTARPLGVVLDDALSVLGIPRHGIADRN